MYNRGINNCSIFQNEQNQLFFLSKLSHYLNEICEVYTYCSMQHHFLLVKIKSKEALLTFAEKRSKSTTTKESGLLYKCSVNEWIN
jgi:histone deacetylase complex regulatory component SIN3